MKTVSGKIESTKPVSLSKAARILSKFASSDNGASPAFSAYLKRASASFAELVHLHKELKGSSPERKSNKHRADGTLTEDAVNSVKKPTEAGLATEEKLERHKRGKRGEGEGRKLEGSQKTDYEQKGHKNKRGEGEPSTEARAGVQKSEGSVNGNAEHVSDDGENLNRKKMNDPESQDGSTEIKNKKKKRKRIDEGEKEQGNGFAAEIEKEEQSQPHNEDAGCSERNKSEKKVKETESRGIEGAKQRNLSDDGSQNVKNEISSASIARSEGKKHKKRTMNGEETRSSGKVEIQEAHRKDSRKKHSEHAHGELDHSQESHKSKKKKRES